MKIEPSAFETLSPYFQQLCLHCGFNPLYGVYQTIDEARQALNAAIDAPEHDTKAVHIAIAELKNTCVVDTARELAQKKVTK